MEKWTVCAKCQKSCILFPMPYIALLIIIIVKDYLSSFLSVYVCFPGCSKTSDCAFY